jgi:hypothetical protein
MAVVEQICRAGSGRSFLHDDYSDVSHIQIDLPTDIEIADGHRRKDSARGERKHLIIVTKGFSVREEQVVCELILQIRIEGVSRTRGCARCASCAREQSTK